jgi:hypothetical protein
MIGNLSWMGLAAFLEDAVLEADGFDRTGKDPLGQSLLKDTVGKLGWEVGKDVVVKGLRSTHPVYVDAKPQPLDFVCGRIPACHRAVRWILAAQPVKTVCKWRFLWPMRATRKPLPRTKADQEPSTPLW